MGSTVNDVSAPPIFPMRLTSEWVAERLRKARESASSSVCGKPDGSLGGPGAPVEAAVLVPLVDRPEGVQVLLTQRTEHLYDHASQISFPGGRVEAGDRSRQDTALREAEEEIGLARQGVAVLGTLPDYVIPTGFRVTPVVGWIEPPFSLNLDPFEVAEAFEAPLGVFLDPSRYHRHSHEFNGATRRYLAMLFEGRYIWGATAGMLYSLFEALRGTPPT